MHAISPEKTSRKNTGVFLAVPSGKTAGRAPLDFKYDIAAKNGTPIIKTDGNSISVFGRIRKTAVPRSGRRQTQRLTGACCAGWFLHQSAGMVAWRIVTSFLPASGQRKSRKPFHDFLLGGAAGGRLVFSFESSSQVDPMMDSTINGKLSLT